MSAALGPLAGRRPTDAVGIVEAAVQTGQCLRVVELDARLFELPIVHLQRGVERRVELDRLEEVRIELLLVVEGLVTLLEGSRCPMARRVTSRRCRSLLALHPSSAVFPDRRTCPRA